MDEIAGQVRQELVEQLMAAEGLSWEEAWKRTAGEDAFDGSVWSRRWIRLAQVAALGVGVSTVVLFFTSLGLVMESHGTRQPIEEPGWYGVLGAILIISFWAAVVGLVGVLFTRSKQRVKVVAAVILLVLLAFLLYPYFAR